jgi:hypothetical protein
MYLSVYVVNQITVANNEKENDDANKCPKCQLWLSTQLLHINLLFLLWVPMILGNRIFKAPVESRLHMINIAFIFVTH